MFKMKKLLFVFMLLVSMKSNAQCWRGDSPLFKTNYREDEPLVTASLIVDNSFKYYQPSGFSGIGVHAGVWVRTLGFSVGWVDSKVNSQVAATRNIAFTLMARGRYFDDKVQVVPFLAIGSKNYQDFGVRVGYYIGSGAYLGAMSSYTMHYGLSLTVSVSRNSK